MIRDFFTAKLRRLDGSVSFEERFKQAVHVSIQFGQVWESASVREQAEMTCALSQAIAREAANVNTRPHPEAVNVHADAAVILFDALARKIGADTAMTPSIQAAFETAIVGLDKPKNHGMYRDLFTLAEARRDASEALKQRLKQSGKFKGY